MLDYGKLIVGQLEFYWDVHLRPRLTGLTDEEYFWEPVDDCWNLRPGPDGMLMMEDQFPAPEPPPVTTIAWRMAHIAVGCFADRANLFFDVSQDGDELPDTADGAVAFLEETYHRWFDRIAALDAEALARPLGPRAGEYGDEPMAAMIVHINREVIHHGGEVALLRDLYREMP
jgi:hypothetical protein